MIMRLKRYGWNILIATDQLLNTILGGDPDETISSRVGKRRNDVERFWATVVDAVFFWQPKHTERSIEIDEGKDGVL